MHRKWYTSSYDARHIPILRTITSPDSIGVSSTKRELSVDDLSGPLFSQNTGLSGFGAAVTALLSAEERQHAVSLLSLAIAAFQALRGKCGCGCVSQLTPTARFVEDH